MASLSLIERALVFYGTVLPDHPRKWWLHGQLRRILGVAIDHDIEVAREGLRWSLNPSDFGHSSLFWLGVKDRWDFYHLRRLVRSGSMILDVGANFGYYALRLACVLKKCCQVHALEPNPGNFNRLLRHITWNGMEGVVRAHQLGVADRTQIVSMTEPSDNSGHTAVAQNGEILGVQLTTLDDFCEAHDFSCLDTLILDVEGLEESALRGAGRSIVRFRPLVFVELFPPVMKRQGSDPASAARILTDLGYQLFAAHRDQLRPLSIMPSGDVRKNAFGIHRDNVPDFLHAATASNR